MTWFTVLAAACSAACTPTLDWREFVPEGSKVGVAFPCRPDRLERAVVIAGETAQMQMLVCTAADMTFAVSFFDVADPARVAVSLKELRTVAVRNVNGAAPQLSLLQVKGMTPNEEASRVTIDGKLPDGAVVREHAAFFAYGLRVYQATVIGANPVPQAVQSFFDGLKFPA
jgi:hypothetical protein